MNTGKIAESGKDKPVYEGPDISLQLQQYTPKNDRDILMKECPAYEKSSDIELVDSSAYNIMEKKKDQDIKLEECPAYVMGK